MRFDMAKRYVASAIAGACALSLLAACGGGDGEAEMVRSTDGPQLEQRRANARRAGQSDADFAFVRYSIDVSGDLPRACLAFSSSLDPNRDYSGYLDISPATQTALSVDGPNLCIGGLTFGQSRDVTIRSGLPAEDGRQLDFDETVEIIFGDRPAYGQGGFRVPVVGACHSCLASWWAAVRGGEMPPEFAVRTRRLAEGYRAWHGGLCLSRRLSGRMLDAAYDYLNWWISGWPGAVVARQGYYMSTPERSRAHMTKAEWDYWYERLPATEDLPGPDGLIRIRKGAVRSGGSYWQRANQIAIWNTTMDEHNYLVRRWLQFVAA